MSVSEARAALPRVLDRVLEGEEVTITRNGAPVAVVVDLSMDAFDADVLICAAMPGHPLGVRVRPLLASGPAGSRLGSVLLLPELLSKPMRLGAAGEIGRLLAVLSRLELRSTDAAVARLAAELGAAHRLRAADAVHLSTAVAGGADRFITNNRKDFERSIGEVEVTYPEDL